MQCMLSEGGGQIQPIYLLIDLYVYVYIYIYITKAAAPFVFRLFERGVYKSLVEPAVIEPLLPAGVRTLSQ